MRFLTSALAVCMFPVSANAAVLLGSTVTEEYRFPELLAPYPFAEYLPQTFVVGAGQESSIIVDDVTTFNVDFGDTSLLLNVDTVLTNPTWTSSNFNGIVFSSSNFSQLSGVGLNSSTNLSGFDLSRVTLTGDQLRLNFAGLSYDTNTIVGLDFSANQAVPEPSTWAMMLLGFGLIGGAMRAARRKPKLAYALSGR